VNISLEDPSGSGCIDMDNTSLCGIPTTLLLRKITQHPSVFQRLYGLIVSERVNLVV